MSGSVAGAVPAGASRRIPEGFLLGTASAAHQVEGGLWNDWMRMERQDPWRIKDGSSAAAAIDHLHRYREDLEMLAGLGQNAQRFSIEWARVEPEPGRFDAAALRHYADVVATCRRLGMEPVVTLHHFTLPVWLADRGGLLDRAAPGLFARYAAVCAEFLGDAVRWWVTINEPNVLAAVAYSAGQWPPHRRSPVAAMRAQAALLRMHVAATRALRDVATRRGHRVMVSIAHHERPFRPLPGSAAARLAAPLPHYLFNRWFLRSCATGRLLPPVGGGQHLPGLAGSLDYLGVNFYTEERVRFDPRAYTTLFVSPQPDPSVPRSAAGWAIDPDAFRRVLTDLWREFHLPLLVTENGVADEDDELRPAYITDHLRAAMEAVREGADLRGYLYWTGFDNFEWLDGYAMRFGLIAVDRATLERRPKRSAAVYAEICRSRVIPPCTPPPGAEVSPPAPGGRARPRVRGSGRPRYPAGRTGSPDPG
ncbi:MAG: glycoside hydrolase family 1 protein [Candidatus Dormibacteria bacterium]